MRRRRLRAYLSGGMEYASNEGADWREEMQRWLTSELNHSVFNPNVESSKFLKRVLPNHDLRKLKFDDIQHFRQVLKGIVKLDSTEIALKSDYVVCLWNQSAQRGAGTKGELTLANYFNKPVYMVTRMSCHRIPGWVLGCTTETFPSFGALKNYLMDVYR
jgi:hypothetical protein